MVGERRLMQEALFYGFSLERHVPSSHMLRKIDRFVDLSRIRAHLEPYYSEVGRPSIDPELMIRMLLVGYCYGIRSERRLCDEAHLNLACRWFCRLGLDGDVPDHSTFSKNHHGRFRESDLLRRLLETVVARCMVEGLVGGEVFAVDDSNIVADARRQRGAAQAGDLDPTSNRAVKEYLAVLGDAAFGGATPVEPKLVSPTDPAARWTAASGGSATRPTPSPRPRLTSSHVESERRPRCCSPTSNASSDSTACDYRVHAAPTTSSSSPPPPRTCGNWPS
jgi:transposase